MATTSTVRSGTISSQLASSDTLLSGGQVVITGSVSSSPVNTTMQVVVLPLLSSTVIVILCVVPSPEAMFAPASGSWVIVSAPAPVQLSVATTSTVRSGTISSQLASSDTLLSGGQVVITGSVSSSPVNTTMHVVVLPLLSSTVMVILCVVPSPEARFAPASGSCVMVSAPAPVQLSVATTSGVRSGTISSHEPFSDTLLSGGQVVITGSVSSSPVNTTMHVVVLPLLSSTVIVILCVAPSPEARFAPASGSWVIVSAPAPVQLSVATTSGVRSGTISSQLASSDTLLSGGQVVITGSVSSSPVNTTMHVVVLPLLSSTVMVILCVVPSPEARFAPASGSCVMVSAPAPVQLSVATTSGVRSGTISSHEPFSDTSLSGGQVVITGSVSSSPVNTTMQIVVLPLLSSTVMVMLCVVPSPEARFAPASGSCVMVSAPAPVQLSVATTSPVRSGTISSQLASSDTLLSGGQVVITGSVSSSPVNTTMQVVVLPLLSSTVIVILCVVPSPEARFAPASGSCVMVSAPAPVQLSVATTSTVRSGTINSQLPSNTTILSGGQVVITGSVSSSPVNTTMQVVVLPLLSSTVMVMLCVVPSPEARFAPASGS
ncbi:hypothetical protein ES705_41163 [subsurface metagenome]